MVHTEAGMMEDREFHKWTPQRMFMIFFYQETVTTEYDYTSQVKTAAET